MDWMKTHDGRTMTLAMMPGYASADAMGELAVTEGRNRGRLWLELMRAHHVGGVEMAGAVLELANTEKVLRPARVQVQVQSYEIEQYDLLLATDYS